VHGRDSSRSAIAVTLLWSERIGEAMMLVAATTKSGEQTEESHVSRLAKY
jgi:hypothetical protein